uniref:Ribonuclease H n=1 Tax=Clastoptera arizonana TaxID=38151 RepID=A0A1B6DWM3_9HEMI
MTKYAVARGYNVGIYDTWEQCEKQITGYKNAKYKKFKTLQEAENFIKEHSNIPVNSTGRQILENSKSEEFIISEDGFVSVFTDGACSRNGFHDAKAGIGVWFNHGHPLNVSEPAKGITTNNSAEIQAVIKAIKIALNAGIAKLNICTDSKFVIQCMTSWIFKWKQNNWKTVSGKPVIHKDMLIVLDELVMKMECVRWEYKKGHSDDIGNTCADELACHGAKMP